MNLHPKPSSSPPLTLTTNTTNTTVNTTLDPALITLPPNLALALILVPTYEQDVRSDDEDSDEEPEPVKKERGAPTKKRTKKVQ